MTPFTEKGEVQHFYDSTLRWRGLCNEFDVDTLLSPYQFEINGKEKIELIRNVNNDGIFNPFFIGKADVKEYNDPSV